MWPFRQRITVTGVLRPGTKFLIEADDGTYWHVVVDPSKRPFFFKRVHATGRKGFGRYLVVEEMVECGE